MLKIGKNQRRINIVIHDHVIRYMEMTEPSLDGVKTFGEKFIPYGVIEAGKIKDETSLQNIVDDIIKEHKWRKRKIYFCVPDASVVVRPYLVPLELTKEEIKGYLYMRIGEDIHLPFEQPIFDFVLIREKEGQQEILLVAYPELRMRSYQDIFEEANVKPLVADLSSLSLYRLYYYLDKAQTKDHLLSLQWNVDACVATVYHECRPVFIRHMKSSLDPEFWQLKETPEGNALEWIGESTDIEGFIQNQIMELERLLNFYRFSITDGQAAVTKILLSGDWPDLSAIKNNLQQELEIPIESMEQKDFGQDTFIPDRFQDVLGLALKDGRLK